MPTAALVEIALGIAGIVALLVVLRWAWNSRKREGGTAEQVDALTGAIGEAAERDQSAREERSLTHAEWKKAGRARRARRTRSKPRK